MTNKLSESSVSHIHEWINDPMFENGVVEMFTSMQGEEMRQYCKCGAVRYVPK